MKKLVLAFLGGVMLLAAATPAPAEEARLLRYPDIHNDKIVFTFGGDLWLVASEGGVARRLTTHPGMEVFAKFSPDGSMIAFTAQYDGNMDVYTMPATGGEPKRITYHPGNDMLLDWYPDGKHLLFRSIRESSSYRFNRLFKISIDGGMPELLPLPEGELTALNGDGTKIAYNRLSREFRTWKRYRGGTAQEVWIYDLTNNTIENITNDAGTDTFPMWQGESIYFVSDRDAVKKRNLYAYDTGAKKITQLTTYGANDYDVAWPSIGPGAIVYDLGGFLHVRDLASGADRKVNVLIYDDGQRIRPEIRNVQQFIHNADISPSGARAIFEARGDIFTVPAEKGDIRNLTATPGIRERNPVWSPNGKWVAYFTDRTGEYQIAIRPADGKGEEKILTTDLKTYLANLSWSPDSKKIGYSDVTITYYVVEIETGKVSKIFHDENNGNSNFIYANWSPDSNWLTYHRSTPAGFTSVYLYNLAESKEYRVTGSLTADSDPAFDPEGKYLYWIANREFNPGFSVFEFNYFHNNAGKVVIATLQKDAANPFAPESDEEKVKEEEKPAEKADEKKADAKAGDKKAAETKDAAKPKEEPKLTKIDLEGLEARMLNLPIGDDNYIAIWPAKDGVYYISAAQNAPGFTLNYFDLKKRESKLVLAGAQGGAISADGKKLLYRQGPNWFIVNAAPGVKPGDGKLNLNDLEMLVDYKAEWKQIYYEAWRQFRDFFYDRGMHGVDWEAMKKRYEVLLPYVAHRDDLNYVIGELIGELNAGHTYRSGGDYPQVKQVNTGVLACDFKADASGYYQITKIYGGQSWDPERQSPLTKPGLNVKAGDYLIAIQGAEVKAPVNVWSHLVNTVGKQVTLKINSKPSAEGAREIVVTPIANDQMHRYIDWVENNIRKVDEATNGQVGYIHVPDTAFGGMEWFNRLFYAQLDKKGLIVDARYNSGGFIPDIYLERLARRLLNVWLSPYSTGFRTPGAAQYGPKVCLTNAWAGSGGDAFPYYFRKLGLGPVIGTRTWGGLIGISGNPPLMDNGSVSVPDFAFVDTDGKFAVENEGVTPDIVLDNDPTLMVKGQDPQLAKALEVIMQMLKEQKDPVPAVPTTFPKR